MNRQKASLFLLMAAASIICFMMAAPFLGYLLTGAILAFILEPAKNLLDRYTSYSSILLVFSTVVFAVLPLLITVSAVANDASNMVDSVKKTSLSLEVVEQRISEFTGGQVDLQLEERLRSSLQTIGSMFVSSTSQIVSMAGSFLIGVSLLLFTEYYALKQGRGFVERSLEMDIMPEDLQKDLYRKTAKTTRTVIKGHVITAMVSGLVAGVGLYIGGIGNIVFWTSLMMILGLVPLVGTTVVWAPAGLYLLVTGDIFGGAFVLLWGLAAVGSVDNFLRPFLVDEEADLHPMFIILGVIGGLGVFGPVGVFVGPVLFGLAKSLYVIYMDHYERFQ